MLLKYIITIILSFNILYVNTFVKPYIINNKRSLILLNNNKRENTHNNSKYNYSMTSNYLNTLNKKIILKNKNSSKISEDYLEQLNQKYKLKIDNVKLSSINVIKKISIDDLIIFNNYIDAIYYNNNSIYDKVIIEFKNNTRKVYYYDNNYNNIKEIFNLKKNIDIIDITDYPYYMLNTPMGFLLCEEK